MTEAKTETRTAVMRAVRLDQGQVRIDQVPSPTGEGVRVRVVAAGICGSDLHLIGHPGIEISSTLGHEIAGHTPDGTPVAIEPISPCGACSPCRAGDYNLCRVRPLLFGVGLDGGMADEIIVPERALVPLPAGVATADASLVEPLAVVVFSLRYAGVRPTDRVAVIGGGTIGLCAVAAGVALGADVALAARHDHQREAGLRLGASMVGDTDLGDGYDIVIEAAGSDSALAQAIEIARPGAKIVVPGIYWGTVSFPGLDFCLKQLSLCPTALYGRHAGGRDVDNAAALIAATPEIARSIITHRFPLDAAPEAFATAAARASGSIKVVLEP